MIVRRTSLSLMLPKMPIMITRSAGTRAGVRRQSQASTVRTVTFANPDAVANSRARCARTGCSSSSVIWIREESSRSANTCIVPAIARAQAQHRALPIHLVQRGADIGLYLAQPPGKIGGAGWSPGLVPLQVVTHAISIDDGDPCPDQASMSKTVQDSGGRLAVNRPSPNA